MSKIEYHLRVGNVEAGEASEVVKQIVKQLSKKQHLDGYIASHEIGKKCGKPHIHIYLRYNSVPSSSTISDFMKRIGKTGQYYHRPQEKDTLSHLVYIVKEHNIISQFGIDKELLAEANNRTDLINEDKQRTIGAKLVNFVKANQLDVSTKYLCCVAVMKFFISLEKAPYGRFQLEAMANNLFIKANKVKQSEAEAVLFSLYGIENTMKCRDRFGHPELTEITPSSPIIDIGDSEEEKIDYDSFDFIN